MSLNGPSRHLALRLLTVAFGAMRKLNGRQNRLAWSRLTHKRREAKPVKC